MRVGAIILAAGSSRRMGGGDKLLADLAGRPVLSWTLSAFEECGAIDDVVVVTSPANRSDVAALCRGVGKVRALVEGGKERQTRSGRDCRRCAPSISSSYTTAHGR